MLYARYKYLMGGEMVSNLLKQGWVYVTVFVDRRITYVNCHDNIRTTPVLYSINPNLLISYKRNKARTLRNVYLSLLTIIICMVLVHPI